MTRTMGLVIGLSLAVVGVAPADAATDYITNGNFETTTATQSTQMTGTTNTNGNVTGWYTNGYNFIFLGNGTTPVVGATAATSNSGTQADTVGTTNGVKLWGPGNSTSNGTNTGTNNGLVTSPVGGNFIGADNNYGVGKISQTVSGLTAGAAYYLSFWWAAAQQQGFDGPTQEQWTVGFGSQTQKTETINLPSHSFSGWKYVTMYFWADAATMSLSFLASGTPGGAPPFSLLDGVSLVAAPEPTTWALMLTGVAGLAGVSRFARRSRKSAAQA